MILAKINGKIKSIDASEDVRYLQTRLEEVAYEYVKEFEVIPLKFYEKSKSKKWGKLPRGYSMVSARDKITVYKKTLNSGWIYSSFQIEKVATFYLIRPDTKKNFVAGETDPHMAYLKRDEFQSIHDDINGRLHSLLMTEEEKKIIDDPALR